MDQKNNGRFSISARKRSFYYAWKGMISVFQAEHNMWIHLGAAVAVVAAGFWYEISEDEWLAVTIAIGLVIMAELFNSAIEKLVDLVSPDFNPKAGVVKDIAAGAVLVSAITAAVVGLIVFIPEIF